MQEMLPLMREAAKLNPDITVEGFLKDHYDKKIKELQDHETKISEKLYALAEDAKEDLRTKYESLK